MEYFLLFVHLLMDTQNIGCFPVLAIVNSAAMNIGVCVSFQMIVFSRCMPKSGHISCNHIVTLFLVL